MPKIPSNLLDLVNSESDEEFASQLGIRTSIATTSTAKIPGAAMAAVKKAARGAAAAKTTKTTAAANKVTKPARKSTSDLRTSGRLQAAIERTEEGRAALAEKTANQQPAPKPTKRRKPPAKEDAVGIDEAPVATKPKGARGRPRKIVAEQDEIPETQQEPAPAPKSAAPKRGRKPASANAAQVEIEIAETQLPEPEPEPQADTMDLDIDMEEGLEDLPSSPHDAPVPCSSSSTSLAARQVPTTYSAARRPTSASDYLSDSNAIGTSDSAAALRRRLGDLTRQHAALEARYRDLRDVAVRDAERNFDRLRLQADERAAAAKELVAGLKSELAAQRELAREGAAAQARLELSERRVDELQEKVAELSTALAESRAESKNLAVKLAAARGSEAAKAAAAVPGSAMKGAGGPGRPNGDAVHAASMLQLKEDLYGDLTGLLVRGVKRQAGGEDVFDCIQTGRNGTLHFKLAICNDTSSENYDEAQYMYMPQLDPGRDRELIDMLPEYLVDEITFPRPHAAKFYARVVKSLTERVEAADE